MQNNKKKSYHHASTRGRQREGAGEARIFPRGAMITLQKGDAVDKYIRMSHLVSGEKKP